MLVRTARNAALLFGVAGLLLALLACTSSLKATATVVDGTVDISASEAEFDVSTIQAAAGVPFTVEFTNHDPVSHDFAVFTREGGELIVRGDLIQGPDVSTEIQVPALAAGTYFFHCDPHADHMKGTIEVGD